MKIYLGADHGGFALKEGFKKYLLVKYPEIVLEDCGAFVDDQKDDYPIIAFAVAGQISSNQELGILFCRSGSGVVIAANKVKGIRAVELYSDKIAAHAKSHNQANIIAFSGDYLSLDQTIKLFEIFSQTPIDKNERHARRIQEIIDYENDNDNEFRR